MLKNWLDPPTKVNIQVYVAFAEDRGEAPGSCGPVAEGLPSLATGLQAWGGDARRRPHSHRVFRRRAALPFRRQGAWGLLAYVLAFRLILGARVRAALERERGVPEHPPLHGHLPGRPRVERYGHGGWGALHRGVRDRSLGLRHHEGDQPRSALRSTHRIGTRLRAARRREALPSGVLRDVSEGGRAPDTDGYRWNRGAWRGARRTHLANCCVQGTGRRFHQPVSRRGRQAYRGRARTRGGSGPRRSHRPARYRPGNHS